MRGAAQLGRPSGPNAEERLALEKNVPVRFYLDFEKPIAELEAKITELKQMSSEEGGVSISTEIETLEDKVNELLVEMYSKLTPWEKTLVARHPERPHCLDYIDALIDEHMQGESGQAGQAKRGGGRKNPKFKPPTNIMSMKQGM